MLRDAIKLDSLGNPVIGWIKIKYRLLSLTWLISIKMKSPFLGTIKQIVDNQNFTSSYCLNAYLAKFPEIVGAE